MTKLYSWNVNGLRACMEKGFREFLEREQPGCVVFTGDEDAASSGGF